jgi:hypothetical protein
MPFSPGVDYDQELLDAGVKELQKRLRWPSVHWGVEQVHDDAWPHVVLAVIQGVEAKIRERALEELLAVTSTQYVYNGAPDPGQALYNEGMNGMLLQIVFEMIHGKIEGKVDEPSAGSQ